MIESAIRNKDKIVPGFKPWLAPIQVRIITVSDKQNEYAENILDVLNKEGYITGARMKFQKHTVAFIRKRYGLKSRFTRLKEQGFLTLQEVSHKIKVPESTLRLWIKKRFIRKHRYNSKNSCLYDLDQKSLFDCLQNTERQGMRRKKFIKLYKSINEVHYEI